MATLGIFRAGTVGGDGRCACRPNAANPRPSSSQESVGEFGCIGMRHGETAHCVEHALPGPRRIWRDECLRFVDHAVGSSASRAASGWVTTAQAI